MERPRTFLKTLTTNSTSYVNMLDVVISPDALGISYLVLSIDPDPSALYQIIVTRILNEVNLEITAIWSVTLPHLTSGVYEGFSPNDHITIRHKTTDVNITVKSGVSLECSEVVEEKRRVVIPKPKVEV